MPGLHSIDEGLQAQAAEVESAHALVHCIQNHGTHLLQDMRAGPPVIRVCLHSLLAQQRAQVLHL